MMKLSGFRTTQLNKSIRLTGQDRQVDQEAFWMEDKPNKVKYVAEKYYL